MVRMREGVLFCVVAVLALLTSACGEGGCPPDSHEFNGRCVCNVGFKEDSHGDCVPAGYADGDEEREETEAFEPEAEGGELEETPASTEHGWVDGNTRLMWMDPPTDYQLDQHTALTYCDELILDDFDDWRLPGIWELRSLIRGCANTAIGGGCNVDGAGCYSDSCRSPDCDGCDRTGECYWPSHLSGECTYFWSSTTTDYRGRWSVQFINARVRSHDDDTRIIYNVRCVRDID